VLREEHEQRFDFEKSKERILRMHEKKHSYAKYVKEIHWPEVSQKK